MPGGTPPNGGGDSPNDSWRLLKVIAFVTGMLGVGYVMKNFEVVKKGSNKHLFDPYQNVESSNFTTMFLNGEFLKLCLLCGVFLFVSVLLLFFLKVNISRYFYDNNNEEPFKSNLEEILEQSQKIEKYLEILSKKEAIMSNLLNEVLIVQQSDRKLLFLGSIISGGILMLIVANMVKMLRAFFFDPQESVELNSKIKLFFEKTNNFCDEYSSELAYFEKNAIFTSLENKHNFFFEIIYSGVFLGFFFVLISAMLDEILQKMRQNFYDPNELLQITDDL